MNQNKFNNHDKLKQYYYNNNYDKRLEQMKQYNIKNRDKILEQQKQNNTCECGCSVNRVNITKHKRTKKH